MEEASVEESGEARLGGKKIFPNHNYLLILAYPENLVKIRLLVEALDELCGTGGEGGYWTVLSIFLSYNWL